jgi:hypothetical protein
VEGAKVLSEGEEKNVLVSEREEKKYPRREILHIMRLLIL